jgi:ABC-type multidrug transport system fused ATPase/permease subunit
LYPAEHGSIRLDGQEVRVNRHWLRHQIGVVLQDPFLYSRSIAANLKVGRPDAPHAHLEQACRDAAIHESIEELQGGYEAMVGERGVTLSGGQRQRLALARALLKDPPVLVLDDSLSAVDTGTEGRILNALRARKGRHTTLVIAHRLSSVIDADRIMVLEAGRCVQLGNTPHCLPWKVRIGIYARSRDPSMPKSAPTSVSAGANEDVRRRQLRRRLRRRSPRAPDGSASGASSSLTRNRISGNWR